MPNLYLGYIIGYYYDSTVSKNDLSITLLNYEKKFGTYLHTYHYSSTKNGLI